MKVLNLGCATKTSGHPSVVNIDWSILLRIRSNPVLKVLAPVLLNGTRLKRFQHLPDNLLVHDLSRGIPFPDASVDVVYHSHMLEHLGREVANGFIRECARVLRPGGLTRACSFCHSAIDDWRSIGLGIVESGNEYKVESLYMGATRRMAKAD